MAKRLTDTEKWKDDWYIQLSNDDKVVWQWLLDNCNHAGVCKKSLGMLNLMCHVTYTESQLFEKMDGRVLSIKNLWFIPKFIKFQYSTLLSGKPVIISVVKDLFSIGCVEMIGELFGDDYKIIEKSFSNHCQMIKDKDKDKDKDKRKDKDIIGINGKNLEKLKGERFDENLEFVIFQDGSMQRLGQEQKILAANKDITPATIIQGSIY